MAEGGTSITRSERQQRAETAARVQAERRRAAGLCTKDAFHGFNRRAGCALTFGHHGRCA